MATRRPGSRRSHRGEIPHCRQPLAHDGWPQIQRGKLREREPTQAQMRFRPCELADHEREESGPQLDAKIEASLAVAPSGMREGVVDPPKQRADLRAPKPQLLGELSAQRFVGLLAGL